MRLMNYLSHFVMVHTQHILHQMISLTDQLHITVFNAIMDHFNKMSRSFISNLQEYQKTVNKKKKCIHSLYKCLHIN